jgi:tripartite-type tricarboxylate transporter receptor subunit TctC
MADVVDYAKANPGKLTFSGAGLFVGHHIAALQLEKAAGVKLA